MQPKVFYADMSNMPSDALIIFFQGEYSILIEKSLDKEKRADRLAHELAHYHTCTLSSINASDEEIKHNEDIANVYMKNKYKGEL